MKKYLLEIKWGVIFILLMLLWMLFERMVGLHSVHIGQHAIWTNFFAIVAIAVYVFALRQKRNTQLNGVMTWKQGFHTGLIITLIIAVLTPIGQALVHTVITPHFFVNAIDYAVTNNKMTQAEALAYFSLDSYLLQSILGAIVMGIITSAVVAWFVKTEAPAK